MKLFALLGAAAAVAAFSTPASATALDLSSGFTGFFDSKTVTGTDFTDTYTFTTTGQTSISGNVGTHWLRDMTTDPATLLADLDILSITLDGHSFLADADNDDIDESFKLNSTLLAAGDHVLTLVFNVDTVTPGSPAGYSGDLTIGAVTPAPEPATWAMFVGAFGLVGAGMRQRRTTRLSYDI